MRKADADALAHDFGLREGGISGDFADCPMKLTRYRKRNNGIVHALFYGDRRF